jgi:hypothetical protein
MHILGLGVHFLIALYFAVHAIRSGREMYWLFVLFSMPGVGSLVYFFAIYLPQSRLDRTISKAGNAVLRSLDPGRDVREAQQAFDLTPTAHNQTRLAAAMLAAGMHAEAVAQYESCLCGPFAADPEIRFGAALAHLENRNSSAALRMLLALRTSHPTFREEQLGLALARAYADSGMHAEAGLEFAATVERFNGIEARAEYALWALSRRDQAVADAQLKELNHSRKHMTKYTKSFHHDLFKRVDAAVQQQTR